MPNRKILLRSFLFLFIFILGFAQAADAAFFDPKLKWYTLTTKHFNIHYHDGEEDVAHRMAIIAEQTFAVMTPQWKWKPWGRTEIVLTDTTDVSNAFTSTLPYNYMLLFIAPPPGDSTLNYYDDWLRDLFVHEFTHTLHLDMYGGIVKPFRWIFGRIVTPNGLTPGWVREGLAVDQESLNGKGRVNNSFSEMMLRTDILNNQFLAIDQMAGLQYEWPSFNAAYIYGGKFWAFLAEKYGQDKLVEFAHRYSNSVWLFSLNNKARKTWDHKNFLKLKAEWKAYLTEKYAKVQQDVTAQGLTTLTDIQHIKGSLDNPTVSPDGSYLIYSKSDYSNKAEIRRINLDGSGDELIYKGRTGNQYSFSPDGKKVAFSSMGGYKTYYKYFDIYELDLETKKTNRVTSGKRAFHPDYSPDGKQIVYAANHLVTTQLFTWDVEKRKATQLTHETETVQFSNPRWSPDGKTIAVSMWKKGNRDIYLFDLQGNVVKQVTNDAAIDLSPVWSKDGAELFFTSDRTGITNVYRYNWAADTTQQASNVLFGLFEPQYVNGKMVVKNYYGRGYDIKSYAYTPSPIEAKAPVSGKKSKRAKKGEGSGRERLSISKENEETAKLNGKNPPAPTPDSGPVPAPQPVPPPAPPSSVRSGKSDSEVSSSSTTTTGPTDLTPPSGSTEGSSGDGGPATFGVTEEPESLPDPSVLGDLQPKKYNPFKKLFVPRYILPGVFFGDSLTFTAMIGSSDPIGRHTWTGGLLYRTDANFLGGLFNYSYNRFKPTLYVNFADFVVSYGDIFANGTSFFEERTRGAVGVNYPLPYGQTIGGYYFFEHRAAESAIPPGVILPPTLGNFSGFGLRYTFSRVAKYPASISLEGGPRLTMSFEATDKALGSSSGNEQVIFSGDLREYVPLPMDGHVLAFRLAGGIAWGDKLLQGTFRLGSALGEGQLSAITPRLFTLRGLPQITFAGERALLMSGEYRLPLAHPQRGLGTGPIHLQKLYAVFFADYGSVFNGKIDFNNFLLGVGAELRADFILGYGLPITGRLGYGIIVSGREFIQGLTDPLTGGKVSNGVLILELGTSF